MKVLSILQRDAGRNKMLRDRDGACSMFQSKGFTIIELMIVVIIVAILASMAVPGFQSMIERRRLIGAAEAVYSDLQFAKSEALKKGVNVNGKIEGSGIDWCFKVAGVTSACGSSFPGVSTTSTFSVTFNHVRGTAFGDSVLFSLGANQIKVSVSTIGRIMICVPSGVPKVGGYRSCPS